MYTSEKGVQASEEEVAEVEVSFRHYEECMWHYDLTYKHVKCSELDGSMERMFSPSRMKTPFRLG